MSKEIRKSFSEEEFRGFFDTLPEASKEYLVSAARAKTQKNRLARVSDC
jgi:hypothetical protein